MATNPSPATLQSEFEQAVAYALHLWQDLSLAVQENWGGPDSSDKRDWLAGAVVELFPDISKLSPSALLQQLQQQNQQPQQQQQNDNSSSSSTEEPDEAYIEEFLLNVMLDEFEVAIDNESAALVAEQIVRARTECLRGKIDGEVADLRRRFSSKRPNEKVNFKLVEQDQEADWDTEDDDDDDDDEDEEMTDAVPELVKKEKKEPEVDEDGFTKVVSKKKK